MANFQKQKRFTNSYLEIRCENTKKKNAKTSNNNSTNFFDGHPLGIGSWENIADSSLFIGASFRIEMPAVQAFIYTSSTLRSNRVNIEKQSNSQIHMRKFDNRKEIKDAKSRIRKCKTLNKASTSFTLHYIDEHPLHKALKRHLGNGSWEEITDFCSLRQSTKSLFLSLLQRFDGVSFDRWLPPSKLVAAKDLFRL